jgi:hypothetical protein
MNQMKNILMLMIILAFAVSCTKDENDLSALNGVTAPSNVTAIFDITQDNTGLVKIIPSADGVTMYKVIFGDVEGEIPTSYKLGEKITHNYSEGLFTVGITAVGLTGLATTYNQEINVTFKAPENLVVTVVKDVTNPRKVTVSATADYSTIMHMYFGDIENEEPSNVLPGEAFEHIYPGPGTYQLTVIALSAATETTVYQEPIVISAASDPINLPITFESFTVNYAFSDFGNATSTVIDNPDASGMNTSLRVGQTVKASGSETWAGSLLTLENPIDFAANKLFKVKVWSPKSGSIVKLKIENLTNGDLNHEVDATTTVASQWEELSFDFSAINMANTYQKVVIFFDFGNAGDGSTYYFDDIKLTSSSVSSGIVGVWKIAPEAGSLGVGPEFGNTSWWAIDAAGVTQRACFFDDTYVFGADGTFSNVLGTDTWIEVWQGVAADACGTPVAPHDGTVAATYVFDAGANKVTLNGIGAYLGIPKAFNGGELTSPAGAPESITYDLTFSENDTRLTVDISIGSGWWRFIMVKEGGAVVTPLTGTWQMAPEAGALGVGPNLGDISWWANSLADVTGRACFFDDTYVFGADGSFSNVLGTDTWIEAWQGAAADGCGAPVAPHNGSAATYTFDAVANKVTLNGTGAYLGIPKPYNGGELTSPANAPASITYDLTFTENNTRMIVDISIGSGWWRFQMVKN